MARTSVRKNYIYNLIYEIFLIIVPIVVTPYVSRVLGADGLGQYSFTSSIVTYFTLFASLGFARYAQREIAKYQGDKHTQSVLFWEIFIIRWMSVIVVLAVYIGLAWGDVYGDPYNTLMWIMTLNVLSIGFDTSYFMQGNENFLGPVVRSIIVRVVGTACIFIFVNDEGDVWVYTLIHSLMTIVSSMSMWLYLPRMLEKVHLKELKPFHHLKPALILFVPTIATSIYTSLDKTMIGVITGSDAENGYYSEAEKMVKMFLTVITALGTVMIPRNSNKNKNGDIEGIRQNINRSCRYVFFLGVPMVLGIVCVANNFVPWFFGDGFEKTATLMMILSPIIIIIGLSNVFGLQFLVPTGKDGRFTIAVSCGAVVNFVSNLFLIHFFQSYGAAIGTLIAETTVTVIMLVFMRKDINFGKILLKSIKYFIAGIVMFIPCFIMGYFLPSSILNTILIVIVGIVVYFGMLFILRDDFFVQNVKLYFGKFIGFFRKKEKSGENGENGESEEGGENAGECGPDGHVGNGGKSENCPDDDEYTGENPKMREDGGGGGG